MPIRATTNDEVFIYGLRDPRTSETRYIGASGDPTSRLREHRADAGWGMSEKCIWIRELSRLDLVPDVEVLEVATSATWEDREQYWIERLRADGASLTNGKPGARRPETRREFYTLDQVASRFGVSVQQVRSDLNRRVIVGARRAKGLLVFGASLETYEPSRSPAPKVRPRKPRPPSMAERLATLESRVAELEALLATNRPSPEEGEAR